jgi:hypothetical protein
MQICIGEVNKSEIGLKIVRFNLCYHKYARKIIYTQGKLFCYSIVGCQFCKLCCTLEHLHSLVISVTICTGEALKCQSIFSQNVKLCVTL